MPLSSLLWVFLTFTFSGSGVAQSVTQDQPDILSEVGKAVTLNCRYNVGFTSWGRTQIDKLIFGKGTRLIVEPKSQPAASPSVFVMKNGTNVACLVKEFYPKDVTISLQSSKKIIEYDPAIAISPGGKYSAVKLGQYGDPDSVTCSVEHNKQTWHSTDFEPKKTIPETTPKPMAYENSTKAEAPVTCQEPQVEPGKVNMMSLSVLGLRMLFAKSVAVNFLLTAKLFFF